MQRFMQEHLTSILQPITEHVQELQEGVEKLTRDLGLTDTRVYGYLSKLEAHDSHISRLRSGQKEAGEALDMLREGLAGAGRRHEELDHRHGETKGDVGRVLREVKAATSSVDQLQRALRQAVDESSGADKALRQELSEANRQIARLQSSFVQLDAEHQKLATLVRLEQSQALQETKELGALNGRRLDQLLAVTDKEREGNEQLFTELRKHDQSLQQELRAASEKMEQEHAANLNSVREELRDVWNNSREVGEKVQALQERLEQSSLERRVDQVEEALQQIACDLESNKGTSDEENPGQGLSDLGKSLQQTTSEIKQQALTVRHLRESDERRSHQLQSIEARTSALEDRARTLAERGDTAEAKIKGCEASHRDTAGKIDQHRLELDRAEQRHQQLSTSLGGTTANLRLLGDQLKLVGQDVAKHTDRLEVAHEYIDGMGKGFQDTHKRMLAGKDGLLPPKGLLLGQEGTPKGSLTPRQLPRLASERREARGGYAAAVAQ